MGYSCWDMTGIHPSSSARLSLNVPAEEENHMGWFCVDDDGSLAKKETHPLLVGHTSVMVAKQPEFKVRIPGGARFGRGLTWGALVLDPVTLVKRKCFVVLEMVAGSPPVRPSHCLSGVLLAKVIGGPMPTVPASPSSVMPQLDQ